MIGAKALPSVVLAGLLVLAPRASPAGQKGARQLSHALIAGTVFREDGLSLRGARVRLEPQGEAAHRQRVKKQEALSDARGEFAFRVPPVASEYLLVAEAPGYERQQRRVQIQGEERIDVFLRLVRASKD